MGQAGVRPAVNSTGPVGGPMFFIAMPVMGRVCRRTRREAVYRCGWLALERGTTMEERSVYHEIAEEALLTTGATLVFLAEFQPGSSDVRLMAWSGLGSALVQRALAVIRRFFPSFDPTRVIAKADVNSWNRAVYFDGETVAAPLQEVAAGIVDDRILHIATAITGIRYSRVCPLLIVGSPDRSRSIPCGP